MESSLTGGGQDRARRTEFVEAVRRELSLDKAPSIRSLFEAYQRGRQPTSAVAPTPKRCRAPAPAPSPAAPIRESITTFLAKLAAGKESRTGLALLLRQLGAVETLKKETGGDDYRHRNVAITHVLRVHPSGADVVFAPTIDARGIWRDTLKAILDLDDGALLELCDATRSAKRRRLSAKHSKIMLESHQRDNDARREAHQRSRQKITKRKTRDQAAMKAEARLLREEGIEDDFGARPTERFVRHSLDDLVLDAPDGLTPGEPVWMKTKDGGKRVLVWCGALELRFALGSSPTSRFEISAVGGSSSSGGNPIAAIIRRKPGDAALMEDGAWDGGKCVGGVWNEGKGRRYHRGQGCLQVLAVSVHVPPRDAVLGRAMDRGAVLEALGLRIATRQRVVAGKHGVLHGFYRAEFETIDGAGFTMEGLEKDAERLASAIRDEPDQFIDCGFKVDRQAKNPKLLTAGLSRVQGKICKRTSRVLKWLKKNGYGDLFEFSHRAAFLGHVRVKLTAYLTLTSGVFHPDGPIDQLHTTEGRGDAD